MNDMVSVIVPVYNAAGFIADTINSVLAQTYTDLELILVDDGSTDDSRKVIEGFVSDRVKLLDNTGRKGAAGARNTGIQNSHGRFVAFLDADDLWDEHKLEIQIAFMKEKDAAFSFTGYEFADANGKGLGRIVRVPESIGYREALGNTTIFTSTVVFDCDRIDRNDILMPYVKSEDTATWWKVLKSGIRAYGIDKSLTMYRRMGTSLSSNKLEAVRRIWNLYRNVEHLSLPSSCRYFVLWAIRAVARRV